MKKLLSLCILLSLVACSKLETNEIKPTRDQEQFTMIVKIIPNENITEFCTNLGVQYDSNGCASYNLDTNECTIYVVKPRHTEDLERFAVIGHETWHCRFGKWHD